MSNGRLPQSYLSDPRLKDLPVDGWIEYDGCVPNINGTQAGSGLNYCSYYMKYPLSGDSEFELTLGSDCQMCSLYYGCGNQQSGTGPVCYCNGAAQWYSGKKCRLTRTKYESDSSACCLVAMSQNDGLVTGRSNTDPPFNWTTIGPNGGGTNYVCNPDLIDRCDANASVIAGYCSDLGLHGTQLAWQTGQPSNGPNTFSKGYCSNYVNAMNVTNKGAAQTVVAAAADFMSTDGSFSNFGANNPKYAATVSDLLGFCNSMGTCDTQLANMCSKYSRDDVSNAYKKYLELVAVNPNDPNAVLYKNIYQSCGCHLPSSQYTEWNNLGVDQVNVACDPICMLPNVIPQYNNGVKASCNQNLCVLDNITIDIVNSQTGNIDFNTVCGNCNAGGNGNSSNSSSSSSCRCIFSNINIFQSGSSVGTINFAQNCGSCSMPDPNNPGSFINIDCKSGMPSGDTPIPGALEKVVKWVSSNKLKTLMIVAVIIAGIWIFVKYMTGQYDKKKVVKSGTDSVTLTELLGDYAPYVEI